MRYNSGARRVAGAFRAICILGSILCGLSFGCSSEPCDGKRGVEGCPCGPDDTCGGGLKCEAGYCLDPSPSGQEQRQPDSEAGSVICGENEAWSGNDQLLCDVHCYTNYYSGFYDRHEMASACCDGLDAFECLSEKTSGIKKTIESGYEDCALSLKHEYYALEIGLRDCLEACGGAYSYYHDCIADAGQLPCYIEYYEVLDACEVNSSEYFNGNTSTPA